MSESTVVAAWLAAMLGGDAALTAAAPGGIHEDVPPAEATYPLVVFSLQTNQDVTGAATQRIMNSALYQIEGIGQGGSFSAIKTVADRIDALLEGGSGEVAEGRVISCARQEEVRYTLLTDGTIYRHLGGLYRIQAQVA